MARPIEYDLTNFLQLSTHLFLEKGYTGTSTRDVFERTKMNRHSFYEKFGDKQGLYKAVLKFYENNMFTPLYAALENPCSGFPAIHKFFDMILAQKGPISCVMHSCYVERDQMQRPCLNIAKKHFTRLQSAIEANLQAEAKRGNLSSKQHVGSFAQIYMGLLHGLPTVAEFSGKTAVRDALRDLETRFRQ